MNLNNLFPFVFGGSFVGTSIPSPLPALSIIPDTEMETDQPEQTNPRIFNVPPYLN